MAWPVTPADVRDGLRQAAASTRVDDPDLTRFAQQAMAWVESQVGPCRGQTFATIVRSRGLSEVVLDHTAAAVTEVTVDGAAFAAYTFDPQESLRRVWGPFPPGRVVLVATAPTAPPGALSVPAEGGGTTVLTSPVEGAAIDLAAHWWLQSRPGAGGDGGAGSPMGYGIPNRVQQKLEPFLETGALA